MTTLTAGNYRTLVSSSNPQIIRTRDATKDLIYVCRNDWSCWLAQRDVNSGNYDWNFDYGTITGNPLGMPLKSDALGGDTHYTMSHGLSYDNNGHTWVHVMGNSHAERWYYTACDITANNPPTPSSWTTPTFASLPWSATGIQMHSYSYWTNTPAGDLILFADQEDSSDPLVAGRDVTAWYLPNGHSTIASSWAPLAPTGAGEFMVTEPSADGSGIPNRAYTGGIVLQTRPASPLGWRLWWNGLWAHRTDPVFNKRNPMILYTDGPLGTGAWKTVDGTTMTLPLTWANYTPAYVTSAPSNSTTGGAFFCIDNQGWPHFMQQDQNIPGQGVELYYDGSAWQTRPVPGQAMSGGAGPGIACLRGTLWFVTNALGRIRLVDQYTHQVVNIGGPVIPGGGARPVPEPMGQRDNTRLTFAIPNGDLPAVYDFGVPVTASS